jgi:antitoxin MazE
MQVARWGNSLAVRLPKRLVEALGLKAGDELTVVVDTPRWIEVAKDDRRERALAAIRARRWTLPPDYRFDRDEANGRRGRT